MHYERRLRSIFATGAISAAFVLAAIAGTASASSSLQHQAQSAEAAGCVIHTLPGLMRQGELKQVGSVGDIVEVECNPAVYPGGTEVEIEDGQLYSRCSLTGGTVTWVNPNEFATDQLKTEKGRGITIELDGAGNANVALVAGPNCAVGGTVVSAHTVPGKGNTTVESFAAAFAVMNARVTPEGVTVMPSEQVEDEGSSSVATLIQAEFASTEAGVRVAAPELYNRCEIAPHVTFLRPSGELVTGVKELVGGSATEPAGLEALRTDNDGNAFVIVLGDSSCKPGKSYFDVDLEAAPFTTEEPSFTILPPQPTPEPEFTIEKLQQIAGGSGAYTTEQLTGAIGQTVQYEIIVKNGDAVPETFTSFLDPECDSGTISGGPTGPVPAGGSATYTCTRALKAAGTYINEAEITGSTVGGRPVTKPSNTVKVVVNAPAFVLEKMQRISGEFTAAPITGTVGQVVDYEITARNTGDVALSFPEEIEDPFCDPGTRAGGPGGVAVSPGGSVTWTCSHLLTTEGTFDNVASVVATPPGEAPIAQPSQPVEVIVGKTTKQLALEKLQRIAGAGAAYTTEPLHATIGQTVEYEIVVSNVGTTPLTLSTPSDPYCDAGTLTGGPGGAALQPGHSTTYTCSRALRVAGSYVNVASVTGTPPGGGPPLEQQTPPVQVAVGSTMPSVPGKGAGPAKTPGPPKGGVLHTCAAKQPVVSGATGPKHGPFAVHITASGAKRITFYIDGRKFKTLTSSPSHEGHFTLTINAAKLSHGAHRLSFTTEMQNVICAREAGSRVFVRPFAARVTPHFTG